MNLHNLKPEKVIKAFERAGWVNRGSRPKISAIRIIGTTMILETAFELKEFITVNHLL